jgi:hypothetical protein
MFFIENDFRTNFIVTTKSKRVPAIDKCFSILPLVAQSKLSHGISEIFKQQVGVGSISEITDFNRQIANALNQRFCPAAVETGSGEGSKVQFFDKKRLDVFEYDRCFIKLRIANVVVFNAN